MIISHKHTFIFLKTNKTAGTSIEIGLSKFCGPDDVITRISPEDEATRRELGYPGPQNDRLSFPRHLLSNWKAFVLAGGYVYNHMPAREVRAAVGEQIWNSYYKFCFERNPWDRVVSLYYWRCQQEPRPTISEFLESGVPKVLKKRGFGVYAINNEVAVDRVCRFENLEQELEQVCNQRLKLPEKLVLPRAKSGYRKDTRHYRDLLSADDRQKVAALFAREIALFGYEF